MYRRGKWTRKNNWSLTSASTGLAVAHDRPEQGNPASFSGRYVWPSHSANPSGWPEYTTDLKLPPRPEERQFYLGEDRHPVKSPVAAASILPPSTDAPDRLIPVMASMDTQSNQLDLLLVQSAGNTCRVWCDWMAHCIRHWPHQLPTIVSWLSMPSPTTAPLCGLRAGGEFRTRRHHPCRTSADEVPPERSGRGYTASCPTLHTGKTGRHPVPASGF